MKISREIKTAVLVIVSISLFIWGYSFLKGKEIFSSNRTFYVEYDNVQGLSKTANITLKGLVIGKINDITMDMVSGKLLVEIQITSDFPISKTSVAAIYEPDFIGGKLIEIELDLNNKEQAQDGQKLKGIIKSGLISSVTNSMRPIQKRFEDVMDNTNQLVMGVNTVLDHDTQDNLKITIAELKKTVRELQIASVGVNAILKDNSSNLNNVVVNFKKASTNMVKISDSLDHADLGKSVKSLNLVLSKMGGLLSDMQEGKGSAGNLLKDESLYKNLNKTTKEMNLLLEDFRLNPTRYVNVSLFGKKNKPYVAPVTDTISTLKK